MPHPEYDLDIIHRDEVTPEQEGFINHWSQAYFGEAAITKRLSSAPVHWRLILRDGEKMVSQVAVTELEVDFDGTRLTVGAIGGLFTPEKFQGRGYANALMDRAEDFIFMKLEFPFGILFCLPALVPFYAKRRWTEIAGPVTLEKNHGNHTWGAATMILFPDRTQTGDHSVHVPNQPKR